MSENIQKKISIGMENFKELIDRDGYFVDKTLMIKDLIESNAKVTLFTRPRRFGKTLNQSMIRCFFEDGITEKGERTDNSYLFDNFAVGRCGDEILKHQGKYPVIFLSMKSAKQPGYEISYNCLVDEIRGEFRRHKYVLDAECLYEDQKRKFHNIMTGKGSYDDYAKAIAFLSECLSRYHGRNAVILIDEYDVPLENAYFEGFYNEMIKFIRSLFESAFKTNDYLYKGVITGCLRISRESIFTGLNNLEVHSIMSIRYDDAFGFTEDEVRQMTEYYKIESNFDEIKSWYDGYRFGKKEIYNPWSILNYINNAIVDTKYLPRPYWSNTSSNSIVRDLVRGADAEARKDLETLMEGRTIRKQVHEDITYDTIDVNRDNIWNFLYFTGYLKAVSEEQQGTKINMELKLPNLEVESIYENSIREWFREEIRQTDLTPLRKALEEGDCETAGEFLSDRLMRTISYYDYDETYYHGFLAGILTAMGNYEVLSNRESGVGRPDIVLKTPRIRNGRAMILELKVSDSFQNMEKKCSQALQQIEDMSYENSLQQEGYEDVLKYGICFYRKECILQKA